MAPVAVVPSRLSDGDLLAEVARLAACEREATAALVALLAEVDARRLYLGEGCASLFTYCTQRLNLSEHAAYHRIEGARAARAFPIILEHLRSGALTLTTVTLLRPHLTVENHERLLAAARGRSKRDVEMLVRGIAPLPDVRSSLRKLPSTLHVPLPDDGAATKPAMSEAHDEQCLAEVGFTQGAPVEARPADAQAAASEPGLAAPDWLPGVTAVDPAVGNATRRTLPASSRPAETRVLAPERYGLRVTLSAEGHARLRRAQDLLRHTVPDGDPAAIVERALALLVEQLERIKFAARRPKTRASAGGDEERAAATATSAGGGPREASADDADKKQE